MALLAEEVVEEWLNQSGFFTIRGIKLGVQEMDILAIKNDGDQIDLRHYEVQASVNPVSYITAVPKAIQKSEGRKPNSAKARTRKELEIGVDEWIKKKFLMQGKAAMRQRLWYGRWSFHFVINKVKHPEELEVFSETEVQIIRLKDILSELKERGANSYTAASKDLIDLMLLDD